MIPLKEFVDTLRKSSILSAIIPLEYGPGLPTIKIIEKKIIISIPFFREVPRKNDKTLIFPIRYVVSAAWQSGTIIDFYETTYSQKFKGIDVTKPVGTFRHDAIKNLNKGEYTEKVKKLYSFYDKLLAFIAGKEPMSIEDQKQFEALLTLLIEPSLVQFYRVFDPEFSQKYLK